MMERLLICGDRNWTDGQLIIDTILKIINVHKKKIGVIIEGEAKGADTLARIAGEQLDIQVLKFPADWKRYGKSAGPIRNRQMVKEGKPTWVIAFHDNIEQSRGTKDMLEVAKKAGIKRSLVTHKV